ncbi:hypothetical protein ACFL35_20855, partial [Candidatus Riflebacteria bacterium]
MKEKASTIVIDFGASLIRLGYFAYPGGKPCITWGKKGSNSTLSMSSCFWVSTNRKEIFIGKKPPGKPVKNRYIFFEDLPGVLEQTTYLEISGSKFPLQKVLKKYFLTFKKKLSELGISRIKNCIFLVSNKFSHFFKKQVTQVCNGINWPKPVFYSFSYVVLKSLLQEKVITNRKNKESDNFVT